MSLSLLGPDEFDQPEEPDEPKVPFTPRGALAELRADLTRRAARPVTEAGRITRLLQGTARWLHARQRRAASADRWRKRYPGASDDEIAYHIVRRTTRLASGIGAAAGAAITSVEVFALLGLHHPVVIGVALAAGELFIVERVQARMVFTLSNLYQRQLGHAEAQEIGQFFTTVLKVKGLTRLAAYGRQAITAFFRWFAVRFLQRSIVKFGVPMVSIAAGAGVNYYLCRRLGRNTLRRLQHEMEIAERLERLLDGPAEVRRVMMSLLIGVGVADGRLDRAERTLLQKVLSEVTADPTDQAALLDTLETDPDELVAQARRTLTDSADRGLAMELMILMAVSNARIHPAERAFMVRVAEALGEKFSEDDIRLRFGALLRGERVRVRQSSHVNSTTDPQAQQASK